MTQGLQAHVVVRSRNVDTRFEVPRGETLGLTGANGTGKTTALDAISGWLAPDDGRIVLNGHTLYEKPSAGTVTMVPVVKRPIGYLSQNPLLFPHLSATQNIQYGMPRAGVAKTDRKRAADDWLERVGIPGLGHRKPHELSGGQAQRVALARILASGPELILLDEPFSAVDKDSVPGLRELVAQVTAGFTTVVVSHDEADIAALADTTHHLS